jgi:hypothetical protein
VGVHEQERVPAPGHQVALRVVDRHPVAVEGRPVGGDEGRRPRAGRADPAVQLGVLLGDAGQPLRVRGRHVLGVRRPVPAQPVLDPVEPADFAAPVRSAVG